jgi:hypothetical protein
MSNYTRAYYERDIPETWFWQHGLIRPDQLAALCYAMGWPFRGGWRAGESYERREPGMVVSIGAGRGELEKVLEKLPGVQNVTGMDNSPGAAEMYEASTLETEIRLELIQEADTVIFCESIEHLPSDVIWAIIESVKPGARIIIVNWPSFHPLPPDGGGWDHITLIDDKLFDQISEGHQVVVRWGSHLVLDM